MIKPIFVFVALFFVSISCFCQTKIEKESRINEDVVPENAKEFIDQATKLNKIKWYYEIGTDSYSYEAKGKLNKQKISIEFSKEGVLEDIEINTCLAKFSAKAYPTIKAYFENNFKDYSVDKLQIQYVGDQQDLLNFLNTGETKQLVENYEFIVFVNEENKQSKREFLFDTQGDLISELFIDQKNIDILNF